MRRRFLAQDTAPEYDVAIVGTGVAGALIGWRLAQAGARVVFIEAGERVNRDEGSARYRAALIQTPGCAYVNQPWAPWPDNADIDAYYVRTGAPDTRFQSTYLRAVGGTTWHWLGSMIRMLPTDFEMKTRYGVAVDWPIHYDELEPWYMEGERQLGVAGDSAYDLGSPRSGGYPLPMIPMTYSDNLFVQAAAKLKLTVEPTPQARNSVEYQGRPPCCGNAHCIPICPIAAKYDAATVHLAMAEKLGATVLENSVVYLIDVDAEGKVSGLHFRHPDTSEGTLTAKLYVIAANAVETPKLLQISRTDKLPEGVANSSGHVGRNLADHPVRLSIAATTDPIYPYRSPLSTAAIEQLREGEFRSERSAFRVEIGNDGWSWPGMNPVGVAAQLIEEGKLGSEIFESIHQTIPHQARLGSLCESLPNENHRVTPAWDQLDEIGIPRPQLTYGIDPYTQTGLDEAQKLHDQMFDAIGVTFRQHVTAWQGAGHEMGTHRMGNDPKSSVTDSFGRTHDHPNLYLAGGGLFPTTGTANPTNTVAALALRAAAEMAKELGVVAVGTPVATPIS